MVTSLSRVHQLVDPVATPQTLRGLHAHRHGSWRAARLGVISDARHLRWKWWHSRINLSLSLLIRVVRGRVMSRRLRWDPVRHLEEEFAGSYASRVVPSGSRWFLTVPGELGCGFDGYWVRPKVQLFVTNSSGPFTMLVLKRRKTHQDLTW
jgi:hypothetical protein